MFINILYYPLLSYGYIQNQFSITNGRGKRLSKFRNFIELERGFIYFDYNDNNNYY